MQEVNLNYVLLTLIVAATAGIVFMLFFLFALIRDKKGKIDGETYIIVKSRLHSRSLTDPQGDEAERARSSVGKWVAMIAILMCATFLSEATGAPQSSRVSGESSRNLLRRA